jgi:pilus assembly protein Flp/PilA
MPLIPLEMGTHFQDGCRIAIQLPSIATAKEQTKKEDRHMNEQLLKLYVKMQNISQALKNENGQDLIEYALVCALIALAATAGMGTVAGDINAAFASIGKKLTTYTS